jgi:hypothetical protein
VTFPFHVVRPQQLDLFKRDVGPYLADTYERWLNHDQVATARRRAETAVEVEVDARAGNAAGLRMLLDFVRR